MPCGLGIRAPPGLLLQGVAGNVLWTLTGRTHTGTVRPGRPDVASFPSGPCQMASLPTGCISGLLAIVSFSLSAVGIGGRSLPRSLCPITRCLFSGMDCRGERSPVPVKLLPKCPLRPTPAPQLESSACLLGPTPRESLLGWGLGRG